MGAVNLTNVTNTIITLSDFTINGTSIAEGGTTINSGETLFSSYSGISYSNFSDLNLNVVSSISSYIYHVNLNRSHYFGGGNFHYPGDGSDVNYILTGYNGLLTSIRFKLAYRQEGADYFLYDDDDKSLDKLD